MNLKLTILIFILISLYIFTAPALSQIAVDIKSIDLLIEENKEGLIIDLTDLNALVSDSLLIGPPVKIRFRFFDANYLSDKKGLEFAKSKIVKKIKVAPLEIKGQKVVDIVVVFNVKPEITKGVSDGKLVYWFTYQGELTQVKETPVEIETTKKDTTTKTYKFPEFLERKPIEYEQIMERDPFLPLEEKEPADDRLGIPKKEGINIRGIKLLAIFYSPGKSRVLVKFGSNYYTLKEGDELEMGFLKSINQNSAIFTIYEEEGYSHDVEVSPGMDIKQIDINLEGKLTPR